MEPVLVTALLVPPILFLLFAAAFAYVDAPDHGMDPVKWAAISFFVPLFGFFAYLFEREERRQSSDRDMFTDGVFEIHESRAGETLVEEGGSVEDGRGDDEGRSEDGRGGGKGRSEDGRGDDEGRSEGERGGGKDRSEHERGGGEVGSEPGEDEPDR